MRIPLVVIKLSSLNNPTINTRTNDNPLLFGDKFKGEAGDFYLTAILPTCIKGIYLDHETHRAAFCKFKYDGFLDKFTFDEQVNYFSDRLREDESILLAKETPNSEIISLHHLTTTVAIATDCSNYGYEARYCFSKTKHLHPATHALYWFILFKGIYCLPIGNCAYRGYIGSNPIANEQTTIDYYETLKLLARKPESNGLSLHEYSAVMAENYIRESKDIIHSKIINLGLNIED